MLPKLIDWYTRHVVLEVLYRRLQLQIASWIILVSSQAELKRSKQSHPHSIYSPEHILAQELEVVPSRPRLYPHVHHLTPHSLQAVRCCASAWSSATSRWTPWSFRFLAPLLAIVLLPAYDLTLVQVALWPDDTTRIQHCRRLGTLHCKSAFLMQGHLFRSWLLLTPSPSKLPAPVIA